MSLFHRFSTFLSFIGALNIAVSIVSACVGAVSLTTIAAAPAYAMCNGMEMMPDGNMEFNPDLCRTPSPPPRVVRQNWTAIAISKSKLKSAISWGAPSKYAAEKAAFDLCSTVHSDCEVVGSRNNGCISVAVSANHSWGDGVDISYIGADNHALADCSYRGGTSCLITAHPCSDDQALNGRFTSLQP